MAEAKVNVINKVTVELTLSEDEARLLKTLFQNSFYVNEDDVLSGFRRSIWQALQDAGVK